MDLEAQTNAEQPRNVILSLTHDEALAVQEALSAKAFHHSEQANQGSTPFGFSPEYHLAARDEFRALSRRASEARREAGR